MNLNDVWPFLQNQISTNQFLTGATLTGALMSIMYFIRGLVFKVYYTLKRYFLVSLTVHSEDALYLPISTWLYENNFDKLSRTYRLRFLNNKAILGPAEGSFFFWYSRKFLRISIVKDAQPGMQSWRAQTKEYLTISYYSLSRSTSILDTITASAVAASESKTISVPAFVHHGGSWKHATQIIKRAKPSVILAGNTLELLEGDISRFFERKDWYIDRGVPYHRGYLLTGPPGTGKTSLVRHLAQRFDLNLYISDGSLASIHTVPPKSILLLEDVDSITKMRNSTLELLGQSNNGSSTPATPTQTGSGNTSVSAQMESLFAPSLSELLNALDGITSAEEIIVVMTTNHPELLDAAVLRPGRVDYRLHLGECSIEQASRLFQKFYAGADVAPFQAVVTKRVYTPAQLQQIFILNETPNEAIEAMALKH